MEGQRQEGDGVEELVIYGGCPSGLHAGVDQQIPYQVSPKGSQADTTDSQYPYD